MIRHEIIYASAGSGKTYQLTNRIIELLSLGIEPERIIALTFSRAAAGEIFDTVITRLARAAASDAAARKLAQDVTRPELHREQCARVLRTLISRMHLSPIGTIDSFFVKVIRAFPFEFGISGNFTILDERAKAFEQARLLSGLLRAPHSRGENEAQQAFMEAFKRATFGREEKNLAEPLQQFIDECYGTYLRAPDAEAWGGEDRIWPDGSFWLADPTADAAHEAETLRRAFAGAGLTDRQRAKIDAFLDLAAGFTPYSVLTDPGKEIFEKLLEVAADLGRGAAAITVFKTVTLTPEMCAPALNLVRHVVRCVLINRLETTRGLCQILERYNAEYDFRLRRAGKLTFADIQFLLGGGLAKDAGPHLSRLEAADERRLYIDYRLDAAYDHWALDEFQDTSRDQWRAIQNLVDEVIQDTSGRRSFLAVGDVKQAIYAWRGGDSRLMTEILEHYNRGVSPKPIQESGLAESRRSGAAVINAVNAVFGHLDTGIALPASAVAQWQRIWGKHETKKPEPGCAALHLLPHVKGARGDEAVARYALVGRLLQEIAPWDRGLTAAVLVRKNQTGQDIVDFLRALGIQAAWGGDAPVADNPVVAAFLALLQVAEHPGDTLAWEHLLMTPFAQCLRSPQPVTPRELSLEVLDSVFNHDFEHTINAWFLRLGKAVALDPFSARRMEEFFAAAQLFDRTGSKNCCEFGDFVRAFTIVDPPEQRAVQVMTMHKSKGLGFDLVFLPDLQSDNILSAGELGLALSEDAAREPEWVLDMPRRSITAADPVLAEYATRTDSDYCFNELCLLYVAMTRAKRGLYMLATAPGEKSTSVTMATVLAATLRAARDTGSRGDTDNTLVYASGDPAWYRSAPLLPPAPAPATAPAAPGKSAAPRRRRFPRRQPSHAESAERSAANLFTPAGRRSRQLGNVLHALLQDIGWLENTPLDDLATAWRRREGEVTEFAEAESILRTALVQDEFRRAFDRPANVSRVELWRERSFEIILGGEWVSGTFDRVVLEYGVDGAPRAATILDFKSNRIGSEEELTAAVENYRPQMALYRAALARITGLPLAAIQITLLFLRLGRVVKVQSVS